MTTNSVQRAALDPDLQRRVQATCYSEAFNNADIADTTFAVGVRGGYANFTSMHWMVASAVQAEYEAGLASGRGSPGHDLDVVTDGAILAAVQAHWPPEVPVVVPPPAS